MAHQFDPPPLHVASGLISFLCLELSLRQISRNGRILKFNVSCVRGYGSGCRLTGSESASREKKPESDPQKNNGLGSDNKGKPEFNIYDYYKGLLNKKYSINY